jgi:hypothetical protein
VISDVPVDDEAPVVTSRISRSVGAQSFESAPVVTSRISRSVGAQSFESAHGDKVCVCVFIGVSMRACCERLRCIVYFLEK